MPPFCCCPFVAPCLINGNPLLTEALGNITSTGGGAGSRSGSFAEYESVLLRRPELPLYVELFIGGNNPEFELLVMRLQDLSEMCGRKGSVGKNGVVPLMLAINDRVRERGMLFAEAALRQRVFTRCYCSHTVRFLGSTNSFFVKQQHR